MEWMRSYGLREHIHDVNGDYDSEDSQYHRVRLR